MDELFWPEKELIQRLRNRSAAVNITTEDINLLAAASAVIYTIDEDETVIGRPQDRRLKIPNANNLSREHGQTGLSQSHASSPAPISTLVNLASS